MLNGLHMYVCICMYIYDSYGLTLCSMEIVLSALAAAGQTGLSHYRQIMSRKLI